VPGTLCTRSVLLYGTMLTIWIDADACPVAVRQVVFRAATRLDLPVKVVANGPMPVPASKRFESVRVGAGPNVADDYIVDHVAPGDVVVTADIPLAQAVVRRGALGIDIRGQLYSENTIGPRAAIRDLLHDLRQEGMRLGEPAPFGKKDVARFAATFDKVLTKRLRECRTGVAEEW